VVREVEPRWSASRWVELVETMKVSIVPFRTPALQQTQCGASVAMR